MAHWSQGTRGTELDRLKLGAEQIGGEITTMAIIIISGGDLHFKGMVKD